MSRLDDKFAAVWKRINEIEISKLYEPSVGSLDRRVNHLENKLWSVTNDQNLLIAALVEAGILIEKEEESKQYLQFGDQKYTIRKVK